MAKKHHKKIKTGKVANNKPSALQDFIWRLHQLNFKAKTMAEKQIVVGWTDESKEQKRAMPKDAALAINKKKGKRWHGEIVSNFDENFVGPGLQAASLATIAKVMNYGRAGGVSKKTGKPYGTIPARPFVEVLKRKHTKPIVSELRKIATSTMTKGSVPTLANENITRLAVICKGQLQRAMKDSNEYKPNAPITVNGGWMANPKNGKPFHVEGKRSERPLWDHGTLINSVDFEIK